MGIAISPRRQGDTEKRLEGRWEAGAFSPGFEDIEEAEGTEMGDRGWHWERCSGAAVGSFGAGLKAGFSEGDGGVEAGAFSGTGGVGAVGGESSRGD